MKAHGSPASRNTTMGSGMGPSGAGELKPHAPGSAAGKKITNFSQLGMKAGKGTKAGK